MAIEKEIKIKLDTGEADKDLKSISDTFDKLTKKAKALEEELKNTTDPKKVAFLKKELAGVKDELGDVEKAGKGAAKSTKGLSAGVKAVGVALKAAGVGLILALFAKFVEVLTRNQKVADALSIAVDTVGNVFTQLITAVTNTFDQISKATNGFEAFGKVIKGIVTLALTPLKVSFFGIKLGLQQAQLVFEKSIFGSGDTKTIEDLNASIAETQQELKDVAKDAVQAGKDIKDNAGQAVGDLVGLAAVGINELGKVSITAANEQAKLSNDLKNASIIAGAQLQGLIEKYDRQAEILRQVRDDDKKSISERIKANEELGKVLEEQAKEQKKLANIRVSAAAQELSLNKGNVEAQKELIEAQNEVAAIEAQVEGFRSEQLVNRNSLLREQEQILKELNQIGKDELELAKQEAKDQLELERKQIELQVENEEEKFRLLEASRIAFDNKIKKLDEEEAARLQEIRDKETERLQKEDEAKLEKAKADFDNEALDFETRLQLIKDREQLLLEATNLTQEQRTKIEQENADARIKIAELEASAKDAVLGKTGQALNDFSKIAGENTAAGKGLAVASSTINTFRGVSDALAATTVTPFETALKFANAAAIGVAGLKNVKEIIKVKIPNVGGAAGGGAGSVPSTGSIERPQAPAFNLTASSGVNQLSGDVEGAAPIKAFVVGSDVTNQQEMDRATFGQAAL